MKQLIFALAALGLFLTSCAPKTVFPEKTLTARHMRPSLRFRKTVPETDRAYLEVLSGF